MSNTNPDITESEGRQIKQCWIKQEREPKLDERKFNFTWYYPFNWRKTQGSSYLVVGMLWDRLLPSGGPRPIENVVFEYAIFGLLHWWRFLHRTTNRVTFEDKRQGRLWLTFRFIISSHLDPAWEGGAGAGRRGLQQGHLGVIVWNQRYVHSLYQGRSIKSEVLKRACDLLHSMRVCKKRKEDGTARIWTGFNLFQEPPSVHFSITLA